MKNIMKIVGKTVFWLGWPVLWVYLHRSTRVRVIVVHNDRILMLKTWLSADKWSLPGGGLHRGEDPKVGVMRELKEETGIVLSVDALLDIGGGTVTHHKLKYAYMAFVAVLDSKPQTKIQHLEIAEAEWVLIKNLNSKNTSHDALEVIARWKQGR